MRTLFLLTLLFTLSFCQRLSPPRNPPLNPLVDPPEGQRCRGRNYDGRRCCTPENPCEYGEGDCDGPGDGGANDGHQGCKGDLVCGSNNCQKFGIYYHEKDDCCDLPETQLTTTRAPPIAPGVPFEPPAGQRCRGRNYDGKRCCTPENPCDEGEGDCDGPGDGGLNDGNAGCKGDLVCGSNNCLQFGAYYHPKDDCCERPNNSPQNSPPSSGGNPRQQQYGWGPWSTWSACSTQCGFGKKSRRRACEGRQCGTDLQHKFENQERPCEGKRCNNIFT